MATEAQKDAVWGVIAAIYLAIEEFGPSGVPSGHLYAAVMGKMGLETYNDIISALVETKKITNSGHLLIATKWTQ